MPTASHQSVHTNQSARRLDRGPGYRMLGGAASAAVLAVTVMIACLGPAQPARADDAGTYDQILNSADAKNDRSGAPSAGTLVGLKTAAATDVAKRQRVLDRLMAGLQAAPVDCGANAELTTRVADTSVVLNEIAGRIAAATDLKVAKAAAAELFPSTRVFSLVQPQVLASLICAETISQSQQMQARIAAGTAALEPLKGTPEAAAALAQVAAINGALKAIPALGPTATSVAPLVADRGDAAVATANAAALAAARVQVRSAEVTLDAAERSVREFERLVDVAKRRAARTTKVKKPVK